VVPPSCRKYDFVFKYIFGNDKHKDVLIALLRDVLGLPAEEFEGIEIVNNELLKEFYEDKKGILDVRVRTTSGKQIDVEIQILPSEYMAERTMFYWSKIYTSQIKPGETCDVLKKCVVINIVDFYCTPLKKLHTKYHLTEDETGYRLTDILEIHFLEIPKLFDHDVERDENDPVVQWMEFIDAKSKGVIELLAERNTDIKKAYDLLKIISKDEKSRMLYESRQAEISDQRTRIKSAEARGIELGKEHKAVEDAINLLKLGVSEEIIVSGIGLPMEKILELKKAIIQ
jgi:predicted transposase/invertase (TIGR01784 family)